MAQAISVEIYQLLEEKLGKEEAKKVATAIELGLEIIEKRAEGVALQKKLEIKDELTKELASKADIAKLEGEIQVVRQEIQTVKTELEGKIGVDILRLENKMVFMDRKFTIMFIILFFTIIFLNQNALEFMLRVLGLVK